jgi:hypothetical protein
MLKSRVIRFAGVFSLVVLVPNAWALNEQLRRLVEWETGANAVSKRSAERIAIEHFEIPLEKLQSDLAKNLDARLRSALIFRKDGQDYVRWIINPEDTKWYKQVEAWLKKNGLSTERHKYFNAYMTASRSYVLEDPNTGYAFSGKVSTDKTGGAWRDKNFPISDARQVRLASDSVEGIVNDVNFDRLKLLLEPAMFGIEEIDQAFGVRLLGDAAEGKRYYIPAFSVLHEKAGREIAKLNGSNDPAAFWKENYARPMGEAWAELAAQFSLTYDSGHGQNFLLELDENMRPTGKVVFRDFADSYIVKGIGEELGWKALMAEWDRENVKPGTLVVSPGMLHGNTPPKWIDRNVYLDWNAEFFEAFEEKFSQLTGIPKDYLQGHPAHVRDFGYVQKGYGLPPAYLRGWKSRIACLSGAAVDSEGKPCPPELLARRKHRVKGGGVCVESLRVLASP